jgi:hypothetical protein
MLRNRRVAQVVAAVGLATVLVVPVLATTLPSTLGEASNIAAAPSVAPTAVPSATPVATATPAPASGSAGMPRPSLALLADRARDRATYTAGRVAVDGRSGLIPGSVDRTSIDLSAEYDVSLTLNYGSRAFNAFSQLTIRNDSGEPIDRVELNTIAARLGGMKVTSVSVDGKAVTATVKDQTITVPLGGILGAGQSVVVKVRYTATLRSTLTGSNWLFARTNGIVDAHRWIPWISKPVAFNRPNHGDPFVTPVSPRVRVTITTDRPLVFATSGERVANDGLKQTFEAKNVRDFALTAAPDYKTMSSTVGDTTVRVYYRSGAPATAIMSAAKKAIAKMEALVGPYPYKVYRVAQTAGGYGMEAPGLTWIPSGVASSNVSYLVTHETGHQWFYGIVGNDQAAEPFTDEAATDFLARYVLGSRRASRCSTARLDLSIYRYSSACYYEIVYIQGGNFLDDIRKRMGNTAFWDGLRDYLADNRFELTKTKTLLDTLDDHTPLNLVPRYEPRFPRLY